MCANCEDGICTNRCIPITDQNAVMSNNCVENGGLKKVIDVDIVIDVDSQEEI